MTALASFRDALSKEKGYSAFLAAMKKARQEEKRLAEEKRKSQLAETKHRVSSQKDDLRSYIAFLKVQIPQVVMSDLEMVKALISMIKSLEAGLSSGELSILQGLKEQADATLMKQPLLIAALSHEVMRQVTPCWSFPAGVKDAQNIRVGVRIHLNPDGHLSGPPQVEDSNRMRSDSLSAPLLKARYAHYAIRAAARSGCH